MVPPLTTIVFDSSVPQSIRIALDGFYFTSPSSERLHGIRNIPPGLHVLHWSSLSFSPSGETPTSTSAEDHFDNLERHGVFFTSKKSRPLLLICKWQYTDLDQNGDKIGNLLISELSDADSSSINNNSQWMKDAVSSEFQYLIDYVQLANQAIEQYPATAKNTQNCGNSSRIQEIDSSDEEKEQSSKSQQKKLADKYNCNENDEDGLLLKNWNEYTKYLSTLVPSGYVPTLLSSINGKEENNVIKVDTNNSTEIFWADLVIQKAFPRYKKNNDITSKYLYHVSTMMPTEHEYNDLISQISNKPSTLSSSAQNIDLSKSPPPSEFLNLPSIGTSKTWRPNANALQKSKDSMDKSWYLKNSIISTLCSPFIDLSSASSLEKQPVSSYSFSYKFVQLLAHYQLLALTFSLFSNLSCASQLRDITYIVVNSEDVCTSTTLPGEDEPVLLEFLNIFYQSLVLFPEQYIVDIISLKYIINKIFTPLYLYCSTLETDPQDPVPDEDKWVFSETPLQDRAVKSKINKLLIEIDYSIFQTKCHENSIISTLSRQTYTDLISLLED